MNAPTVPRRSSPGRGRAVLWGTLVLSLAAGVLLWAAHGHRGTAASTRRTAPVAKVQPDEMARLRDFTRSVAGRVVLLQPGEELPLHLLEHEDGSNDDEFRSPRPESVSPEMLFEGALRDAAAEQKLTVEQARTALRGFVAQVRAGRAAEFLDPALASFAERDYAGAERLALAAAAQSEPAGGTGDAAGQLLQVIADSGNLREASVRQRAALQLAGDARMMQSKFWEAETSYRAAGRLVSKTDVARWIETQWRVAQAKGERGHFNVSLPLWREIAEVCSAKLGPHDRKTFTAQSWVAWEMEHPGKAKESAQLEARVLAQRMKLFGPDDLDVARSLTSYGRGSEHYALAREMEALGIRERVLGPDHPETLRSLRRAMQAYGGFPERLARKCLAASERIFGPDDLEAADDALMLAKGLDEENDGPEIEGLRRRALAIHERHWGWDSGPVLQEQRDLDDLLLKLNKRPEMEQALRRRLADCEKKFGPEHVEVVRVLSVLAWYQGDTSNPKVLETRRRIVALCDRLLGDAPEDVADLGVRSTLLREQRSALQAIASAVEPEVAAAEHLGYRFAEASVRLLKTRVEMAERAQGPEHADVASYLEDYAGFVARWKKVEDALPHWRRAFEIRLKAFGPEEHSTLEPLRALYAAQETPEGLRESEALARRMLALQENWPGADPRQLGSRLTELAAILHEQGQRAELEPLLRRARAALQTGQPQPRPAHRPLAFDPLAPPGTGASVVDFGDFGDFGDNGLAEASVMLADVLREAGRPAEAAPLYREAIALNEASTGRYGKRTAAEQSVELSALLGELGQFTEAEALLAKAFKLFKEEGSWGDASGHLEARATEGFLCAQQGRYSEARTGLTDVVRWTKEVIKEQDKMNESIRRNWEIDVLQQGTGGSRGYVNTLLPWTRTGRAPLARYEKWLAETEAALAKGAGGGKAGRQ